jgi:hypothetical protein
MVRRSIEFGQIQAAPKTTSNFYEILDLDPEAIIINLIILAGKYD